jgi:hypothetical protein
MTIHGRANYYGGDGQLRIWRIGTHHEYQPDESSWGTVIGWREAGVKESDRPKYASPASAVYLYWRFSHLPDRALQETISPDSKGQECFSPALRSG